MKKNKIAQKIIDRYGTIKHFCKLKGYNYNTFRTVLYGNGKSRVVEEILRKEGFIR